RTSGGGAAAGEETKGEREGAGKGGPPERGGEKNFCVVVTAVIVARPRSSARRCTVAKSSTFQRAEKREDMTQPPEHRWQCYGEATSRQRACGRAWAAHWHQACPFLGREAEHVALRRHHAVSKWQDFQRGRIGHGRLALFLLVLWLACNRL